MPALGGMVAVPRVVTPGRSCGVYNQKGSEDPQDQTSSHVSTVVRGGSIDHEAGTVILRTMRGVWKRSKPGI